MADRVLVEIVTAANMTGIKQAQAGFLGMSNALSAAIVGLGVLAVAGKSAMEISEKHEKAENDLAQALKSTGRYAYGAEAAIQAFIDANRAFITDQAEAIDGYATLIRSGLSFTETQLDMNRALDLAALKHISLSDAVALVNNAEHGRLRGLVDLGITSKAYVDSSGNMIDANKNMARVMAELDAKTAHGRDTTTQMTQATNRLGNDWQDIANNVGPPLLGLFDGILRGADFVIQKLNELGRNKDWNAAISAGLGFIQDQITMLIRGAQQLIDAFKWLAGNVPQANAIAAGTPGRYGRQGGGYVWPGNTYTVGESRPEGLTMFPGGGGYVSSSAPSSSGGGSRGSMTVNVYGYVGDNRQLALTIREQLRRLDREQR